MSIWPMHSLCRRKVFRFVPFEWYPSSVSVGLCVRLVSSVRSFSHSSRLSIIIKSLSIIIIQQILRLCVCVWVSSPKNASNPCVLTIRLHAFRGPLLVRCITESMCYFIQLAHILCVSHLYQHICSSFEKIENETFNCACVCAVCARWVAYRQSYGRRQCNASVKRQLPH